jgi:hypothetical protein
VLGLEAFCFGGFSAFGLRTSLLDFFCPLAMSAPVKLPATMIELLPKHVVAFQQMHLAQPASATAQASVATEI